MLNRDSRQFGKKFMFDGQEETCWNSDQVHVYSTHVYSGASVIRKPLGPLPKLGGSPHHFRDCCVQISMELGLNTSLASSVGSHCHWFQIACNK